MLGDEEMDEIEETEVIEAEPEFEIGMLLVGEREEPEEIDEDPELEIGILLIDEIEEPD